MRLVAIEIAAPKPSQYSKVKVESKRAWDDLSYGNRKYWVWAATKDGQHKGSRPKLAKLPKLLYHGTTATQAWKILNNGAANLHFSADPNYSKTFVAHEDRPVLLAIKSSLLDRKRITPSDNLDDLYNIQYKAKLPPTAFKVIAIAK